MSSNPLSKKVNAKNIPLTLKDWFVAIPEGKIQMRDDRTNDQWEVRIQPFYLAKYPITQELFEKIMGQNPATFKGYKLPVESISWIETILFCNALSRLSGLDPCYNYYEGLEKVTFKENANGYRLPTEAEWQYACQAGSTEIRYGELEDIAWFKDNSMDKTQEVGLKEPNAWGLFDMLGNVWEWCSDVYDETVYGSYRIFRGGGWCDEERSVMATTRRRSHQKAFKIDDLGFRIAQNKN